MPTPRKVPAEVTHIERCTDDLYILTFKPLVRVPRFKAGNFLQLAIDDYDPAMAWPHSRVFSIANSPKAAKQCIRLVCSRIGAFTERMFAELKVGSTVWLRLPYGDFHVVPDEGCTQVLVAGGSGISPFLSFLEQAVDEGLESKIRLFYGVRTMAHFAGMDVINRAQEICGNFACRRFVESNDSSDDNTVVLGRLSLPSILSSLDDIEHCNFYLSGPPMMIDSFRGGLLERGLAPERVRSDDW